MPTCAQQLRLLPAVVLSLLIIGQAGCSNMPSNTKLDELNSPKQSTANTDEAGLVGPNVSYTLDHWTDFYEANKKGEGRLYFEAISKQAEILNTLSMHELCTRILRNIDAFEDEARWYNFIDRLMHSGPTCKLQWAEVLDLYLRLQLLLNDNLTWQKISLQEILNPNAHPRARQALQQSMVRAEKELPVIQRDRRALVEAIIGRVLKGSSDSMSPQIEDAKILKTMAIRGSQ